MIIYRNGKTLLLLLLVAGMLFSCKRTATVPAGTAANSSLPMPPGKERDARISLGLNAMQKHHQKMIMRDHLAAVQRITDLLSRDEYDKAAHVARERLGTTTKMQMMCASFGDEHFEKLGLAFHESADRMSETLRHGNKNKSLQALSNTIGYCVQCHETYRQ